MQTEDITTRFGLIRHAETEWNRKKKIQGHTDSPLTPEGKLNAQRWGGVLAGCKWNRLIVSDLGRAIETATFVNSSLKVSLHKDSRLCEQNWGRWEGKSLKKIDDNMLAASIEEGWKFCPPGGEDRISVRDRSQIALTEAAARWPGEMILVVTHEGVIKCLIYGLTGRKFLPTEPPLLRSNHLHFVINDGKGLKIDTINALDLTL